MKTRFKVFIAAFLLLMVFLDMEMPKENEINNIGTLPAYASSMEGDVKPLFIGHRGYIGEAPENTVPSYIRAKHKKFWGGETDINTTKDGKWVVLHDSKIDRTTNGKGKVNDLTLNEIKKYRIKCGSHLKLYGKLKVPTFEEYLKTCRDVGISPVIEFKPECDIKKVHDAIDIIRKYDMAKKCICISFRFPVLMEIRKEDKNMKLQWLLNSEFNDNHLQSVLTLGQNSGIDINRKYVSEDLVKKCHDNRLEVNCWTVNEKDESLKFADWGVDYITSDKLSHL